MNKFQELYESFMNENKVYEYVLITYKGEDIDKDASYLLKSKYHDLDIDSYNNDHAPVLGSNQVIYKLEDAPFVPKEELKLKESKDKWNIEGIAKTVIDDMKENNADILDVDDYLTDVKHSLQGRASKSEMERVIADVRDYVEEHYED